MIRTAIAGTENNLIHYVDTIRNTPGSLLTGILSPKPANGNGSLPFFPDFLYKKTEELTDISDALIVTDNPGYFYDTISRFLKKSRHVMIMPDASISFQKLKKLVKIADEAGVSIYFHHNTLDTAIKKKINTFISRPEFIDLNCRIKKTCDKPGNTLFDLLMRELYLIISLNHYNPKKITASSVPFFSTDPVLINGRIEFENGTTVGLNITSLTGEDSRILDIYGNNKMVRYDLLRHNITMIDKDFPEPFIINSEEIRSIIKNEDAFTSFFNTVGKDMMAGPGITAHLLAAGIMEQIAPCPVRN